MIKRFQKYLGGILLLIGLGITSYSVFNFTNSSAGINLDMFMGENIYYYKESTLLFIGAGVVLIGLGVLMIKNRE